MIKEYFWCNTSRLTLAVSVMTHHVDHIRTRVPSISKSYMLVSLLCKRLDMALNVTSFPLHFYGPTTAKIKANNDTYFKCEIVENVFRNSMLRDRASRSCVSASWFHATQVLNATLRTRFGYTAHRTTLPVLPGHEPTLNTPPHPRGRGAEASLDAQEVVRSILPPRWL